MKLNKTQVAVLLIFSILSLEWRPNNIALPASAAKKIQLLRHEANLAFSINHFFYAAAEKNSIIPYNGITLNYTKLKLTKEKFNQLKSKEKDNATTGNDKNNEIDRQKKNVIIFQFNYLSQIYPYPALKAYPRIVKGKDVVFGMPVDLEYLISKPLPDLSVCNEQVTGDLQISFYDMEILKMESNPKDKEEYDYFLFTPKFDDPTHHVYFEISIFPSTNPDLLFKSKDVKPSPPYN